MNRQKHVFDLAVWGALCSTAFAVSGCSERTPLGLDELPHPTQLSMAGPAAAPTWIELNTVGGPSGDDFHGFRGSSVDYDAANNRLIVFSPRSFGFGHSGVDPSLTGDVWVLTNANGLGGTPVWTKLASSGPAPGIHFEPTAVYDPNTNRLIVYGGGFFHTSPALNGAFVLTNANGLGGSPTWSQLSVTNAPCFNFLGRPGVCIGPQARLQHSAVYDPSSQRMIAVGGQLAFFGTTQNDTRVLSNANGVASPSTWTSLSTSGGPPPVRAGHKAIYDQASNRMVIYAGFILQKNFCCGFPSGNMTDDYGDLWVLTNANGLGGTPTWVQQTPAGTIPPDRGSHSTIYDSAKNRMIVFGGATIVDFVTQTSATLGDLWELSNANGLGGTPTWTQLSPSGTPPGQLSGHGAAFDVANQRMIVFAGVPDLLGTPQNRVWVLIFTQMVSIDIKPGSDPSSWSCKKENDPLPVAILSAADFDATTVDAHSVRFGKDGTEAAEVHKESSEAKRHVEDVNKDGKDDMVFHFRFGDTGFSCDDLDGEKSANLTGKLTGATQDGTAIEGEDGLRLVKE